MKGAAAGRHEACPVATKRPRAPFSRTPMAFMPAPTPANLIERALKKPASTIWLGHVGVRTARFDEALAFYNGTLGLTLRAIESVPTDPGRLRALFVDAEGHDVLELLEHEAAPPADEQTPTLSFRLPLRTWHALRARLGAQQVPYDETAGRLYVRDADGRLLRIEPLSG